MGVAITQVLTVLDGATATTNWVPASGGSAAVNTDVFPPGASSSISDKISNEVDGLLYDDGGIGTFASGDHVGIWYNFLFGELSDRASGGLRFRVAGASVANFAEIYIDGVDSGKSGWQYVVASLDRVLANPDAIGGTPPTIGQIQHIGVVMNILSTVGGNNDNLALGAISHIPDGTVALRYEGTGTGSSGDFDWNDIAVATLADTARGIVTKNSEGVFIINAPIEFGDTTISSVDTNLVDQGIVLAFGNQEYVEPDFMGITVSANSTDTVQVNAGAKLGSGETAVGVGGWTVISGGPRWFIEAEDANMDGFNMYGCSFFGSSTWAIDDAAVEIISCVFLDCDTITMTGVVSGGPVLLSNFFAAAPGPRAQIVFTSGVTPFNGQFDFNGFANMKWFAIEIPAATAQFDLRGVTFAGNGTNRDVLLSNTTGDIQLNVLETGDTPGVTNGATITVTMTGACDAFAVMAGTWSEALGTETNDLGSATGTLVTQTTASLAVDDDTFAIAAVSAGGDFADILDYSGASDEYEDGPVGNVPSVGGGMIMRQGIDEATFAAATRVGFPVYSGTETESVQGIVHVDAAAGGTPVVNLDSLTASLKPSLRPWQIVENASAVTFSYGAGNSDSGKGAVDAERYLYVAVVALDGVAANTAVSTIVLNHSGGTDALAARTTTFPVQDDNVGSTGRSLELDVWDYDVDDAGSFPIDQGTYDVNNNVTVTVVGLTEGATATMLAAAGGPLSVGTVIGTFPTLADSAGEASSSHSFTSDQPVDVRTRYSGAAISAIQEDNSTASFTGFTVESNDSTVNNVILMPATEAVEDAFYVGMLTTYNDLTFTVSSGQGRAGTWSVTWEYWNGSIWTALSNVVDGTDSFANTGCPMVTWDLPGDWAVTAVAAAGETTTTLFFVRARISSFTGAGSGPTATKVNGNPTKYLPFNSSATIESTGLTIPAVWVEDTIAGG